MKSTLLDSEGRKKLYRRVNDHHNARRGKSKDSETSQYLFDNNLADTIESSVIDSTSIGISSDKNIPMVITPIGKLRASRKTYVESVRSINIYHCRE